MLGLTEIAGPHLKGHSPVAALVGALHQLLLRSSATSLSQWKGLANFVITSCYSFKIDFEKRTFTWLISLYFASVQSS